MRQQRFCSLVLAALFLAPLLIAAPEALRAHTHEGVVYTSDQTWSGNMSLDEDVVIASGATLLIESGTYINVTEDITITIQGNLQIQGTTEAPVTIWGLGLQRTLSKLAGKASYSTRVCYIRFACDDFRLQRWF
ncbi:MAG: hypothetical protein Ct9H90mP16_11880 [Candidatus Poseidoniales archaeon]|nr:MAG: hypothetical protein Ct9H90mP16_11880 [Candidatus Poseidoniales archaeon]